MNLAVKLFNDMRNYKIFSKMFVYDCDAGTNKIPRESQSESI